MNSERLQKERTQLYEDFYNYKLPKRLPVSIMLSHPIAAQYADISLIDSQYDFSRLADTAEKLCDLVYSDTCPVPGGGVSSRFPKFFQLLKSQTFQMSASGYMQHPEVSGMHEDEYEDLIRAPYDFILEKVIPRHYKNLDPSNPIVMAKTIPMAMAARENDNNKLASFIRPLVQKHGYYQGAPRGSNGFTAAPYDFLADQLRGFTEISKDIRRNRNKIKEACEALYPLMFRLGLPQNPHSSGLVNTPLHMPTFMREKDFVEVWLPTYKRLCEEYAALGVRINAFCEDDWTRYLDILQELPAGIQLRFEYGDPKTIKDKLGKKFIIGGLYPLNLIKHGTKQQCIDKAKELLDIMMPGGGYVFGFDKGPIMLSDINMENLCAVAETVRDYGAYPNAGESYGTPLNSEGFTCDLEKSTHIESKYLFNWDSFKSENPYAPNFARSELESLDDTMFKFYLGLLT